MPAANFYSRASTNEATDRSISRRGPHFSSYFESGWELLETIALATSWEERVSNSSCASSGTYEGHIDPQESSFRQTWRRLACSAWQSETLETAWGVVKGAYIVYPAQLSRWSQRTPRARLTRTRCRRYRHTFLRHSRAQMLTTGSYGGYILALSTAPLTNCSNAGGKPHGQPFGLLPAEQFVAYVVTIRPLSL